MYISEVMDGAPAETRGDLETRTYRKLEELHIPFQRVDNDSVEAMEDCVAISEKLGAEIRKTIVVCNRKKTSVFLVILPADKPFQTKIFSEKVGCSRMSFASAETMRDLLGTEPGSASVMDLLNDPDEDVQVVIDTAVAKEEWFACNPGVNTSHIRFKTDDLLHTFLPKISHRPVLADL
ncbi:MAG: prolyl-tRNA synthetase associated domain-containing protein [Lachnospiraceae bacterium]|nr:prolyl-tRNA synthetase associated domain-containing protein [Lachnospiraceae bacterium]